MHHRPTIGQRILGSIREGAIVGLLAGFVLLLAFAAYSCAYVDQNPYLGCMNIDWPQYEKFVFLAVTTGLVIGFFNPKVR